MFSHTTGTDQGFSLIHLHDETTGTHLSIAPECGAILHDFSVLRNGTRHHLLATYANIEEFRNRLTEKGFMGCKLSPFAGRLCAGHFSFSGESFHTGRFFLGKHALHGFLFDAPFLVERTEAGASFAEAELVYAYRGGYAGFPFHYNCRILYRLEESNRLTVTTIVESADNRPFPLQDGWHPYFSFGRNIGEVLLELQSESVADTDETMIPTGTWSPYGNYRTAKTIGDTHFDHCFRLSNAPGSPALSLNDSRSGIGLEVIARKGYPYLQLYTPSDRLSVAVEPMSAPPDTFNNKIALLVLNPGESREFVVEFKILTR
jgi:aldose 1-epimerase